MKKKRVIILFISILAIAAILRAYHLLSALNDNQELFNQFQEISILETPPQYALLIQKKPYKKIVSQDSIRYLGHAWKISNTKSYGNDGPQSSGCQVFGMPGYPVFLAIIFKIFGFKLQPVLIAQVLISLLTVIFVFLLGKEIGGVYCGLIAEGLVALNWFIFKWDIRILTENPAIFLIIAIFYFFIKWQKQKKPIFLFYSGIFYAFGILQRPTVIYAIAPLFIPLIYYNNDPSGKYFKNRILRILLFSFLGIIFSVTWMSRNKIYTGKYQLSQDGPFLFWLGNTEFGYQFYLGERFSIPDEGYEKTANEMIKEAFSWIVNHPYRWATLSFYKMTAFWGFGNIWDLKSTDLPHILFVIISTIYLIFGIYGLGIYFHDKRGFLTFLILYLCILTIMHTLTVSESRYRVVFIDPLAMVGAAYFMVHKNCFDIKAMLARIIKPGRPLSKKGY